MSFSRLQKLDAQLAEWRAKLDSGQEPDDAEAASRVAVLNELQEIANQARENPAAAAAARTAIEHDAGEQHRIRFALQLRRKEAEGAAKRAHRAARPQRWAALPLEVRAAYRAAEVAPSAMRKAFFAFAEALLAKEPGNPSRLFEPESIPGVDTIEQVGGYSGQHQW